MLWAELFENYKFGADVVGPLLMFRVRVLAVVRPPFLRPGTFFKKPVKSGNVSVPDADDKKRPEERAVEL